MEISSLHFSGYVDIVTPGPPPPPGCTNPPGIRSTPPKGCTGHPGELTLSDLFGSSLGDIVNVAITGGADLRADAVVDFSSLGSRLRATSCRRSR